MSLADKYHAFKRKALDGVKASLVNDNAPGAYLKAGGRSPKLEELRQLSERYQFASLLPYEAYDEESGLYYNMDTVGFMLYGNPATGLTQESLRTLNGFFNQSHKAEATIQVSIIADTNVDGLLEKWADLKTSFSDETANEVFKAISEERINYLKQGKWNSLFSDQSVLIRNYHFILSYTIPVPQGLKSVEISQDDVDNLTRLKRSTMGTLQSSGIACVDMYPDYLVNVLHSVLNPAKGRQPVLRYDENQLLRNQLVDEDTQVLFDSGVSSIIHQGEHFSVLPFHVKQFPNIWAGFNNGFLIGAFDDNVKRIPCPFVFSLTVNAPDQLTAKGKVKRKSIKATQMADSPIAKYVPEWKDRKNDWEFTQKKMDDGNKLMEAFYQIVLITPEGREQECEQVLKSLYESKGWVLSRSRYIPMHSFLGALPMGMCQETKKALKIFGHFSSRLSWTCTNISPWIGEWKGTVTPMMLFQGRRGQLTYFNPFDNRKGNFNISCSATSGSGKSFFTQEWVYSCLGSGGRAFIIDAGHSYKELCQLFGGTYLDFGDDSLNLKLNPFSGIGEDDPKLFQDQLPLLKMLIAKMASPDTPITQKQRSVLEKAIMRAWESKGSKASISTVIEMLSTDDSDDGLMHATAKDLAVMLYSWGSEGMYADYFEGEANVDLNNQFVVLDLDALNSTKDLQSVVMMILMMRITQVMYLSGNKSQQKLCIIDEAWRLLAMDGAGEFIAEGYRVARKHGGSFMTITQKISDYYTSEAAKAAYANSDFKVYLRQDPDELTDAEIKGYISNSGGKVDLIRSLETIQGKYSELAISSPDGIAALRFVVDPVTEKIYSTKHTEVDFIRNAVAQGMSVMDAVRKLASSDQSR